MQIIRKSEAGEDIGDEGNIPVGKQRQQCVLIIHLVAPRIEYQSYGKSSLTLEPFQSVIAKTIEEVISRIPLKSRYNPRIVRPPSVIECLRQFLEKRWEDVRRNPGILDPNSEDYDAMTQSTVWYNLRKQYLLPIEEKYGVTIIKENTREDVTAKISSICENDLEGHPKREQLGIFASPRATMYVDGSWHDVDINEIPALAKKGTDVVFIEKRGVVEIVKYIGDIYGFAFVNTQGHFAEYPKDLSREIIENGGNVLILTDFDCSGIHIAEKVISDVIGEEEYFDLIRDEKIVFELKPPYEIIDADLAPPENLHAKEEETGYRKTIYKLQKPQYSKYSGRVVRLGIDIQTLEYFVSKTSTHENSKLEVKKMKERVEEEYPKHTDPKKQQPGKNVITPIIAYAKRYHSYLKDPTNPNLSRYKRYDYIYNNFEYLTGISLDDLYNEDIECVIKNRKTARRIEMDSVIEEVKPPVFAQFICDKTQEFFPERNYNRAIRPPTGYFGDKFSILPESIKELFLHITSAADAAAKPTEHHIELEQTTVKGLLNLSNTKEANKNRISEAVAQDAKMKIIDSKCAEVLDKLEGNDK
jgi:5S rRNA maturation endonuclease (ribonuclease M5)